MPDAPPARGGTLMRNALCVLAVCLLSGAAMANDFPVERFGAKGEGGSDDAPAIVKALQAAAAERGGRVLLGPKDYRLEAPITVPPGVILEGTWEGPHFPPQGTVIFATAGAGKAD